MANSTFTVWVLVKTSAAISRTVWRRVLPRGGSKHPTVVGIVSNRCCEKKSKHIINIILHKYLYVELSNISKTLKTCPIAHNDYFHFFQKKKPYRQICQGQSVYPVLRLITQVYRYWSYRHLTVHFNMPWLPSSFM